MVRGMSAWAAAVVVCGVLGSSPLAQRGPDVRVSEWGGPELKLLGIGTKATAFIILEGADCVPCVGSVPFYKSLMKLPGMDGKVRRVVVLAKSGVWPVKNMLDAQGFTPHRLNSGPYPRGTITGITVAPSIVVVDGKGVQRGKWEGELSADRRKAVIAALMN